MNTNRAIHATRLLAAFVACLGLAVLPGCGGDSSKATVSGKVTYKGAPVTGGTLTLTPASGSPYPVNINANGTFNVADAPVGSMGVAISTDNVPTTSGYQFPKDMTPPKDTKVPEPPAVDASNQPKKVDIPAKYKDAKTSGLTWDVKGGKNTKDFDLTD